MANFNNTKNFKALNFAIQGFESHFFNLALYIILIVYVIRKS